MLGASTIVGITTILCYGIIQSESIFSLLGSAATSGVATTDDTFEGGDDYMYNNDADEGREDGDDGGENNRNDEHQQRFLSEDNNHENETQMQQDRMKGLIVAKIMQHGICAFSTPQTKKRSCYICHT